MKATKVSRRGHPVATAAKPLTIAPERSPQLWPAALAMLAAVIAVFYVYGPAMSGPFLLDDSYLPYRLDNFANASLSDWMRGLRPLLMLSFWLNFQEVGSASTGPYHFVNVLLHLLNGGLAFLIVRKVLEWAHVDKSRLNILASFAAGLFLLHPLQTESVTYIASRSETLSVFFFLGAFTVFLYRRSVSASWLIAAFVLLLFGAACMSKEHAVVLPGLLLLTDYFWNPGFSVRGMRGNWKLYLPIAIGALVGLAFVGRVLRASNSAGFNLQDVTWYQYFFTQCRAFWRYVLLFFFPLGQNIDHDFPVSKTIADHGAVIGLVGLLALIAAAWIYRRRFPLISYGVFVILLLFAPTSSFVPIRDTLVEHRMYLPFIGFLFIAAGLLQFWRPSRSTLIGALTVVLLIAAGLTYQRNRLYSSAIDIWADSVAKSPNKWRPNFQLAYAYYDAQPQQCPEAVTQFSKTAKLQKPDYSLLVDWGLAADCAGNSSEALSKLQQAAGLDKTAHIYSQIGMEYAKLAQYPQALDALDTAAKLDPNFGRTYVYRGNVYALQGKRAEAVAEYQHALQIDPADQYARDNLIKVSQR
jgi:predicted negative regulator of RcsB-dependent stress response